MMPVQMLKFELNNAKKRYESLPVKWATKSVRAALKVQIEFLEKSVEMMRGMK